MLVILMLISKSRNKKRIFLCFVVKLFLILSLFFFFSISGVGAACFYHIHLSISGKSDFSLLHTHIFKYKLNSTDGEFMGGRGAKDREDGWRGGVEGLGVKWGLWGFQTFMKSR